MYKKNAIFNKTIELILILTVLMSGVFSMYEYCFNSLYKSISTSGCFGRAWILNAPNDLGYKKKTPRDLKDEQTGTIGGESSSCTGTPCAFIQSGDEKTLSFEVGYLQNLRTSCCLNFSNTNCQREDTFGRNYIDTNVVMLC